MHDALPSLPIPPHTRFDDVQALVTAILLVALGLSMLRSAGLLTGGVPGLAFLVHYAGGLPLGWSLLLANLPFLVLAWRALGSRFTVKTLIAVGSLSLGVEGVAAVLALQSAHPLFAAIAGGVLIGVGLLVLFRHGASLGGVGVLALHLQRRRGWSAGAVQMAIDAAIVAASLAIVEPRRVAWSVAGCLAVNLVLMCNHRPGRYAPAPL